MRPKQLLIDKVQQEKKKKNSRSKLSLSALYPPETKKKVNFKQDLDISRSMHISYNFSDQGIERVSIISIRDYKNLVELDLSNNKLSQPQPELLYLQYLKTLNLSNNGIVKMYALSANLESLNISNNAIRDLSFVIPLLTNLQELNISFNQITSLSNLSGNKTELIQLEAHHNQIDDLEGVETMVNLKALDVGSNLLKELKHVQYIRDLSNLDILDISENPLLEEKNQFDQLYKVIPKYLQQKSPGVYCQKFLLGQQTFIQQLDFEEQNIDQLTKQQLQQQLDKYQQKLKEKEEEIQFLKKQAQEQSSKPQETNSTSNQGQQNAEQHLRTAMQKNVQNIREISKLKKELNTTSTQIKQYSIIFDQVKQFLGKIYALDQVEQMSQDFQQITQGLTNRKSQRNQYSPKSNSQQKTEVIQQNSNQKIIKNLNEQRENPNQVNNNQQDKNQVNDYLIQQNIKLQNGKEKYKQLYKELKQEYERLQEEMNETTNNFMDKIRQVEKQILKSPRVSFQTQNSGILSPQNNSMQQELLSKEQAGENKKKNQQQKIIQYVEHLKERNRKYKDLIVKLLDQRNQLKEQIGGVSDVLTRKSSHDILKSTEFNKKSAEILKLKQKQNHEYYS